MNQDNLLVPTPDPAPAGMDGAKARADDKAWKGEPPDPLRNPEIYSGILWRRTMAYMADLFILFFIIGLAWVVFIIAGVLTFGLFNPLLWGFFLLIPLLYHSILIGGARSATFGMRMFDVEVRDWSGTRPDFLQAAVVTVLFYISVGATTWLILLVSLFTNRNRALHDMIANVIVVRTLPLKFTAELAAHNPTANGDG